MTGGGKDGKGLGKGGAKRHRRVLGYNIQVIAKPAIRRLARRGGVKRISGLIFEETSGVVKVSFKLAASARKGGGKKSTSASNAAANSSSSKAAKSDTAAKSPKSPSKAKKSNKAGPTKKPNAPKPKSAKTATSTVRVAAGEDAKSKHPVSPKKKK
ncbi:hypothetical protein GWI33_020560 [Rhynchophorus ferrugineus]|uniref:Histone H4 n=1 Tax=Rhynchophorus ferrugineus TaxID=354439 RepID=A0A834M0D5_RHYFE|nr:hypothetical protein GWI33_020560 [Rhynchophorus ferrugineus]